MHTHSEPNYTYDPALESHPLFVYAQQAFQAVDRRFPRGAVNRAPSLRSMKNLGTVLTKLDRFKVLHEEYLKTNDPAVLEQWKAIFSTLKSGDSELMTYFALGYLRANHTDTSLFNVANIPRSIPLHTLVQGTLGDLFTAHHFLLIGNFNKKADGGIDWSQVLFCDVWVRAIYLGSAFRSRQIRHENLEVYFLINQIPHKVCYDYLEGKVHVLSNAENYKAFDSLVEPSDLEADFACSTFVAETKVMPHHVGLFAANSQHLEKQRQQWEKKRQLWESKNPTILGYFSENGTEHQLRRINKVQFAYWDPSTPELVQVTQNNVRHEKGRFMIKQLMRDELGNDVERFVFLTRKPAENAFESEQKGSIGPA